MTTELTITAALEFEARTWQHETWKQEAIRSEFGITETRYYARVGRMLDDHEQLLVALEYDPRTTKRLLARREERARARHRRHLR